MSIKIKDVLQLDIMKNFTLETAGDDLDRIVENAGILDFEFTGAKKRGRSGDFAENDFVLSSLLFAKDEPGLINEALEALIEKKISCFAYKKAFFDRLPEDALELAERGGLCVLSFGEDVFFEDVIYDILSLVRRADKEQEKTQFVEDMIKGVLSREQIRKRLAEINSSLCKYVKAVYFRHAVSMTGFPEKLAKRCFLCRYGSGSMMYLTSDISSEQSAKAALEDVYYYLGIDRRAHSIGLSSIYETDKEIDRASREAVNAALTGDILSESMVEYSDIGIFRLIYENGDRGGLESYMRKYLEPVLDKEDSNSVELFQTALSYCMAKGDLEATAQMMCCHKNTIRYRVNRLHELLSPGKVQKVFFSELMAAIAIYLVTVRTS